MLNGDRRFLADVIVIILTIISIDIFIDRINKYFKCSLSFTYFKSSWFSSSLVIFTFISLNVFVSKSSSWDFVIVNQILSSLLNLFCNESNTWLNDASPSHVTWIVSLNNGVHEQGDISGRIEQCNDATWTIETSVYISEPMLNGFQIMFSLWIWSRFSIFFFIVIFF